MKKQEIINIIKKYPLALDETYTKGNETFPLICDGIVVNKMSFRQPSEICFIGNTLWIGEANIEVENVEKFRILFTSIKYELEDIKIKTKIRKDFKLK